MTSSVVMNPRSLPLATRSRTSSSWASLANAIWSSTFRASVGSTPEYPSASGRGFPKDSPSGLESDEVSEYGVVVVGLLDRVHALKSCLERIDVAGQAQFLQPVKHAFSVPALLFPREWLDREAAQEAPFDLV